jgi:hypothetical protein
LGKTTIKGLWAKITGKSETLEELVVIIEGLEKQVNEWEKL